jgi:uncharacterized Zn finger protein
MITKDSIYCPRCGKEFYLEELASGDDVIVIDREHFLDCLSCGAIDISVFLSDVETEPNPHVNEEDRGEDDNIISSYWAETEMHWEEETLHD